MCILNIRDVTNMVNGRSVIAQRLWRQYQEMMLQEEPEMSPERNGRLNILNNLKTRIQGEITVGDLLTRLAFQVFTNTDGYNEFVQQIATLDTNRDTSLVEICSWPVGFLQELNLVYTCRYETIPRLDQYVDFSKRQLEVLKQYYSQLEATVIGSGAGAENSVYHNPLQNIVSDRLLLDTNFELQNE